MGRRAVFYTVDGGESGSASDEDFDLHYPQEEEYQVVDEWDPSMDETPPNIVEEQPESPLPSEDETALVEISSPMVGMGKKETITFREGECHRAFRGALYCRTIIPQETQLIYPQSSRR